MGSFLYPGLPTPTSFKPLSRYSHVLFLFIGVVFITVSAQVQIPSAPILRFPANNKTDIWPVTGLSWNESPWSTMYRIQLSNDSIFSIKTIDTLLAEHGLDGGFYEPSTTYYWRVNAQNATGISPWSSVWRFTTRFYSTALKSPQKYQTGVSINPELKWDSVYNAKTYWVQVSTDSNFTTSIINDSLITTASKIIGPLLYSTIYYWRVNYKNKSDAIGIWSEKWAFATAPSTASISQGFSSPFSGLFYSGHVIKYALPATLNVSMKILDLQGKVVWRLASTAQNAGYYCQNIRNNNIRPGQYFLEFKAGSYSVVKQISMID